MASRSLFDLTDELAQKAGEIIKKCDERGVDLLIYCTYRSLEEQAKLYRQSRKTSQIETKANGLTSKGFDFLADVLIGVGPQYGKVGAHVTYAGPGESWHNFKRAFDAVPLIGGKAMWQVSHPHWQIYGEIVAETGLEWAGNWTRFREYPHSQLASGGNPLKVLAPDEIRELLG